MTKDQKRDLMLQERASSFERIANLLLTLDSHRNFHRRVQEEVVETQTRLREIYRQPTTTSSASEQFPLCEYCKQVTTSKPSSPPTLKTKSYEPPMS